MGVLRETLARLAEGGRMVGSVGGSVKRSVSRVLRSFRNTFNQIEAHIDDFAGTRVPKLPLGGRTMTVVLAALVIGLAVLIGFDVRGSFAAGVVAGIIGSDFLVRIVVVLAGIISGVFAWGQLRIIETTDRARALSTSLITVGVSSGLAVWYGIIDPVGILLGLFGDVVITGAMAGVAAVTGLVSAASGRTMGAGRKGTAAAGLVGVISGGFMAAAVAPAGVGIVAITLTILLENLLPAALFGAAIVFFVTDPLKNIGSFSASLAFVIRIATVAGLSYIAAGTIEGINLPFLSLLPVIISVERARAPGSPNPTNCIANGPIASHWVVSNLTSASRRVA